MTDTFLTRKKPGRKPLDAIHSVRWGPAMLALTDLQRLFVLELVDQGEKPNFAEAARRAGYAETTSNSLYVTACNLVGNPKIKAALLEVVTARFTAALPLAAKVIKDLAASPGREQFKAAKDILDRGGLMAVQKIEKKVTHENLLTDVQMVDSIRSMCEDLGIDPKRLLGDRAGQKVIDAQFETIVEDGDERMTDDTLIDAEAPAEAGVSFAGLEDLL